MTTYVYNVSQNGGLTTIQQAINLMVGELSAGEVPLDDITIFVGDGRYPGFTIPSGTLMPLLGTSHKLIIKSAGRYFPIIDFNESPASQIIGADIGSANPNVVIEGLRFQFFAVGIRSALNSHNPKINKCIVVNCRNVGIFIDQSNNCQVLQTIVANGDYGIVARLCKNIALIHNTVFLNGSISTNLGSAESAIWCQLANDYGGGLSDSGKLYLVGNIAWNTAGATLTLFTDDVERPQGILSNYNNFVVGDPGRFISVEDRAFTQTPSDTPRSVVQNLQSWKARGFDLNSKSDDPRFIAAVSVGIGRTRHAINLDLMPMSPVKAMVPNFARDSVAAAAWLPSYVDSSDLRDDSLGNTRQPNLTSAGANDKPSTSGFYGRDILVSPIELDQDPNCGTNPLIDIVSKKLDLWYPKYRVGFFYSNDREYYLYAKKGFATIGSLAVTKFTLPHRVDMNHPIRLLIGGQYQAASSYLDIIGDEVYFFHKDLAISSGDEEIEIQYSIPTVKTGNTPYLTYTETQTRFKVKEGKTRYFLPTQYVARGPVVITDDTLYPTNTDLVCNREFAVEWDSKMQQAEIIFHKNNNLVQNPQFDYFPSGLPLRWTSLASRVEAGEAPNFSIAGPNVCAIYPTGYIGQEFPITSGTSTLSWYSYSDAPLTGRLEMKFYDGHNRDLGYTVQRTFVSSKPWNRYYITIGQTGDLSSVQLPEDIPYVHLQSSDVPTNSAIVAANIIPYGTGVLRVSAVQYEHLDYPTYFTRVPFANEMTVEFETKESDEYVDIGQPMASVVTTQNEGFLYIPELPAQAFFGPKDPSVTTLHEWRWPEGRKLYLPWARLMGKDKLRKRTTTTFNSYPQKADHPSAPAYFSPKAKTIELVPTNVLVTQGDEDGAVFTINIRDTNDNPISNASFACYITDFNQRFPGWLHRKYFGSKQQLGQTVFGRLDAGGNATITWVPPTKESCVLNIPVPIPSSTASNGQSISIIRTKYPVNLDFNGNVTILDAEGNLLNKNLDIIEGFYRPAYTNSQSLITLEYPVKPGSVAVSVGKEVLSEVFVSQPESDQFYVDYENAIIVLKGRRANVSLQYTPTYTFVNKSDLYKIMVYHDKVFSNANGTVTVGHDSVLKLTVNVLDYAINGQVSQSFDMIATNPLQSSKSVINRAYLEI